MFGIGFQELLLIMVVALIVLGPQRLPEVAKSLGKFYREIKGSIDDVKESITKDVSALKSIQEEQIYDTKVKTINKSDDKVSFEDEFESEIKRERVSFKKENSEV